MLGKALGTDVRSLLAQHLEAANTAQEEKEKAAAAEPPTPWQSWEQLRKARAADATAENKRRNAEKHRDKLKAQTDAANTKLNEAAEEQEKAAHDLMLAKAVFLRITPQGQRRELLEEAGFDELLAQEPEAGTAAGGKGQGGVQGQGQGLGAGGEDEADIEMDLEDKQQLVRLREEVENFTKAASERKIAKRARLAKEAEPAVPAPAGEAGSAAASGEQGGLQGK